MEEEKPSQKRPKVELPKPKPFFTPPISVVPRVSFYGDPTRTFNSAEEKKRAEIQSMMRTWKHYYTALEAYDSIYVKTSDDLRGMRECHQRIGEGYGDLHQLSMESYLAAFECCTKIPSREITPVDRQAIAQIFSALINAANGLASHWLTNIDQMDKFLVFYLKNFEFLNEAQPTFLSLDGIDWNKLSARTHEWAKNSVIARTHIAVIKMFGEEAGRPSIVSESEIAKLKAKSVGEFSLLHFAVEKTQTSLFREKVRALQEREGRMLPSPKKSPRK